MKKTANQRSSKKWDSKRNFFLELDLSFLEQPLVKGVNAPYSHRGIEALRKDLSLYKCFLFLCAKYPKEKIFPLDFLDTIWQTHVLFTKKYHSFCIRVFGRFLHYTPELPLGPRTTSAYAKSSLRNSRMEILWKKEFPEMVEKIWEGERCGGFAVYRY